MTLYIVRSNYTGNSLVEATSLREAVEKVKKHYYKLFVERTEDPEFCKFVLRLALESFTVEKARIIK